MKTFQILMILISFLFLSCEKENILDDLNKIEARNYILSDYATQNQTQVIPWGVERVGYGSGVGKRVWIMDYGVDAKHPDLDVDTILSRNFFGSNSTATEDIINHGTCIAGVVAAKDNDFGVRGVAAGAKVISIKFAYLYEFGFKDAIDYMISNYKRGDVVIIASYQAPHQVDVRNEQAIIKLANRGFKIVIAAGNSAVDVSTFSPQRLKHKNIFPISAFGQGDIFWSKSNFGPGIKYSQPGVNIYTTSSGGGYGTYSGTSFAAPHFAGLLLLGKIKTDGTVLNDLDSIPDKIAVN
jgi:subtilisin family serine protease